ncbi:MCE family protein, partial [Pseudonocardia acaciae]|uniref:MCE family protein n=1 Tax=Pseudonocardia acaciae TaxID=551276 RepID=UPI000562FC94
MITRKVKIQLIVFMVIAAVGVIYTGARYAGLDRLVGAGGYRVDVQLADASGITPNSEVTYRGVAVGQVTDVRLARGGVVAGLRIQDGAPPIPADARAVVANRSAVGEQHIDLRPERTTAPYLADGSVIPRERTTLPPRPAQVLTNLDRLAASVPTESLRTTVSELGTAFAGTGPSLRALVEGSGALTQTATEHLPQTVGLLRNSGTVLRTQQQQGDDILEFSRGLEQLSAGLKDADPDLRRVIKASPEVAGQVSWLLDDSGDALSEVVRNALTLSRVTEHRTSALEQLLVTFPVVNAIGPTLAPDGRGHLGLVLNFYDPPTCTKGYEGTKQRRADDFTPIKTNYKARCAEPRGSPTSVRGAQNAPTPGR